MFRITAETCRAFTLAEILILAAINLELICKPESETQEVQGILEAK
jgi:hypothetical protein